jgi:hypothetical protein
MGTPKNRRLTETAEMKILTKMTNKRRADKVRNEDIRKPCEGEKVTGSILEEKSGMNISQQRVTA